MRHIRVLAAEIGPRPAGSTGDALAVDYVAGIFRKAGLDTVMQPVVRRSGVRTHNVIARAPGSVTRPILVVGAHLDTEQGVPGANDNASGAGLLLALAEALRARPGGVEFVAFGAEEYDRGSQARIEGSRAYLRALNGKLSVKSMISLDMIGNGSLVYIVHQRGRSREVAEALGDIAMRLRISFRLRAEGESSDHVAFSEIGIPSAHLWSGVHPAMHTAADTIEVVQPASVRRIGRLALHWILQETSP